MVLNDALKHYPELERVFREWGKMSGVDDIAVGEVEIDWEPKEFSINNKMLEIISLIGLLIMVSTPIVFILACISIASPISWFPPQLIYLCVPMIILFMCLLRLFIWADKKQMQQDERQMQHDKKLKEETIRIMLSSSRYWRIHFDERRRRIDKEEWQNHWSKVNKYICSIM